MPKPLPNEVRVIPNYGWGSIVSGLFAPAVSELVKGGISSWFPSGQDDYYRALAGYTQTQADALRQKAAGVGGLPQAQYMVAHGHNPEDVAKLTGYPVGLLTGAHLPEARRMVQMEQAQQYLNPYPNLPAPSGQVATSSDDLFATPLQYNGAINTPYNKPYNDPIHTPYNKPNTIAPSTGDEGEVSPEGYPLPTLISVDDDEDVSLSPEGYPIPKQIPVDDYDSVLRPPRYEPGAAPPPTAGERLFPEYEKVPLTAEDLKDLPPRRPEMLADPSYTPPSLSSYKDPADVVWSMYPKGTESAQEQLRNWKEALPAVQWLNKAMQEQDYISQWFKGERPTAIQLASYHQTQQQFENLLITQAQTAGFDDPYAAAAGMNDKVIEDAEIVFMSASLEGRKYLTEMGVTPERIAEAAKNPVIRDMPAATRNGFFKWYVLPRVAMSQQARTFSLEARKKLADVAKTEADRIDTLASAEGRRAAADYQRAMARGADAQTAHTREVTKLLPLEFREKMRVSDAAILDATRKTDLMLQQLRSNQSTMRAAMMMEPMKTRITADMMMFDKAMEHALSVYRRGGGGGGAAGGVSGSEVDPTRAYAALITQQGELIKQIREHDEMILKAARLQMDTSEVRAARAALEKKLGENEVAVKQLLEQQRQDAGVDPVEIYQRVWSTYQEFHQQQKSAYDDYAQLSIYLAQNMQSDGTIEFPQWPASTIPITDAKSFSLLRKLPGWLADSREYHLQRYRRVLPFAEWETTPIISDSPVTPSQAIPNSQDRKWFYDKYYYENVATQIPMAPQRGP